MPDSPASPGLVWSRFISAGRPLKRHIEALRGALVRLTATFGLGLTVVASITFGLELEAGSVIVRPVEPAGLWLD